MTDTKIFQKSQIFRPDSLPRIDRGNGATTVPLATAARGATTFLNGITTFRPGAAIGHHTHNVVESVMVIAGSAVVDIDGERSFLKTFDTTLVPANVPHHFENASATEEMAIFWTYASLDATRTLLSDGAYGRIDAEHPNEQGSQARPVTEALSVVVSPQHVNHFEEAIATLAPVFQSSWGSRTMRLDQDITHPERYELILGWNRTETGTDLWDTGLRSIWDDLVVPCLLGEPVHQIREETATYF